MLDEKQHPTEIGRIEWRKQDKKPSRLSHFSVEHEKPWHGRILKSILTEKINFWFKKITLFVIRP